MKTLLVLVTSFIIATTLSARELTVYTYSSFTSSWGPGPALKEAFEAQCNGCTVRYVSSDDGVSLLNRVRLEGANTQADIVLGLDVALIAEARALNLFQPHSINFNGLNLDPALAWNDDLYVPYDFGYFAFIYDRNAISQPATSMAELLASDASIIYQDPRTSTVGQGLMHWMETLYGDDVSTAWQALAERTVTVTQGWSEAYGMFLEGEADYVLSYTTSPAYHMVAEDTDHYQAALFSEGHVTQIEVAGISAHSNQVELAQEFLAFLLDAEAQAIIPVTNWMLPVRTDIELPEAFDQLINPTRVGQSPEAIQAQRQAWIRTWRNAVSQ